MEKLKLSVNIDYNAGFCFGVVKAIRKAEKNLVNNPELYCLGEIVHNDEEVNRLGSEGLKIIQKENLNTLKNKTILFRAHGEPPSSYEISRKNHNTIIDASCPIILGIQARLKKSYNNNENIYIYGKSNHPEIIGLNGQIDNQAVIFESITDLDLDKIPSHITLYSQTTKSLEDFRKIIEYLEANGIKVKVEDTICRQVSNRKEQLIEFCKKYNKVLFVAGKNSSNGKVLYDICKSANPDTLLISTVNEVKKEWFKPNEKIGISGATSTPMWLMDKVKSYLLTF